MSVKDLGHFILRRLRELDISQTELANRTGISRKNINGIINGKVEPKMDTMVTLARHMKVHPNTLFRELFKGWRLPSAQPTNTLHTQDAIGFIQDVTYPDNSAVSVGARFIKSWEIENIGNQTWRDRSLVCLDGEFDIVPKGAVVKAPLKQRGLQPHSRKIPIPETFVGERTVLSVEFTAPDYPCSVFSYWKIVDQEGNLCFPENEGLSCHIQVIGF